MSHAHHLECEILFKNINGYVDGELDPDLCAAIEAHINSCHNCQIIVNTLKKTIQLYQITGLEISLPADMRQRLFARLNLENDVEKDSSS